MPYKDTSEVPAYVPESKKKQWLEVFNSAHAKAKKDGKSGDEADKSAFAQANGVAGPNSKASTMKMELRYVVKEIRAAEDGNAIEGYAARFNSMSEELMPGVREVIKPGAFKRALKEGQDVKALINHDPNRVLGRTSAGTLKLTEDSKGLKFRVELPDTSYARDLYQSVKRGDMDQCSFGFSTVPDGERWTNTRETPSYRSLIEGMGKDEECMVRELHDVDLFDVSVVTNPAYKDTVAQARDFTEVVAEFRAAQAEADKATADAAAAEATRAAQAVEAAKQKNVTLSHRLKLQQQKLKM
jgi:uncharacterized protein